MAAIDIGDAAIHRGASFSQGYTVISKGNPANATGKITSISIWAHNDMANVEVAIFFVVAGNNLSTRDIQTIGAVPAGLQVFAVDLDVEVGDYIGFYDTSGEIEDDGTGSGVWYSEPAADRIPCTNQVFDPIADLAISLYGTGKTLGGPKSNPSLILIGHGGI